MSALLASAVAGAARFATGAHIRWLGPPPAPGPAVYFANHTSHLDFLAIWSALPPDVRSRTRPVAAKEYWEKNRVRRALASRVFRAILVDRGEGVALSERGRQFELMVAALDAGDALILFPEGRRGPGPDVEPFKGGLFHLARRKPGVPLVPIHLENLNRILPRGEFLLVPLLCRVTTGAPISLREGETKGDFLTRAREAVLALHAP
jgi:1-acyl-sn-glycerol-3-phosphate acyltransferase